MLTQAAIAILIGLFAGVLSGFFGIGGASVTTPLMRILLGVPGQVALGTPLILVIPSSIAGAYVFHRKGLLKFKTIAACGISGAVFAVFGALATTGFTGTQLMLITSGVLILFAGMVFLDRKKGEYADCGLSLAEKAVRSVFIGSFAGFVSGFLGLGGGFILVPLLTVLRKIPLHQSIACSLGIISVYAIPGSIAHFALGNIDIPLAAMILVGQVAGAYVGAVKVLNVKEEKLKPLIAGFFALLGISLAAFELLFAQ